MRPESLRSPEMSHPLPFGLQLFPQHLFPSLLSPYISVFLSLHLSLPLSSHLPPLFISLFICTASHLVSLRFRLSLSALCLSPCLTHWDMLLTSAQTPCQLPSPHPPCDLCPSPTALSGFSSFKRHVNYYNEVRRDPTSAIQSQEHCTPPASCLLLTHPHWAGWGTPILSVPSASPLPRISVE